MYIFSITSGTQKPKPKNTLDICNSLTKFLSHSMYGNLENL